MTIRERWVEDRAAMANMDVRGKMRFLWAYYRIPILALGFACLLVVLTVLTAGGQGKRAMYAVLINADSAMGSQQELDQILESGGISLDGRHVTVSADWKLGMGQAENMDVQTLQVLTALFGSSGMDFFAADEETFARFASLGALADLQEYISSPVPEEDLLRYRIPNGTTILCGIRLHPGSPLHQAGFYHTDVIVGIPANPAKREEAVCFLQQLLQ